MKNKITLVIVCLLITCLSCKQQPDINKLFSEIESKISSGDLNSVSGLADKIRKNFPSVPSAINKTDSLMQIAERIPLDFSMNEEQVIDKLSKIPGGYSEAEKKDWENNQWLEWRMINGEKRYFNRSVSNLVLIKNFNLERSKRDSAIASEKEIIFRKIHTSGIIKSSVHPGDPVSAVGLKIDYTLTLEPNTIPSGEIVRCWLPYPKENNPRQKAVTFLNASQPDYLISPDSLIHRTVYMEAKAVQDKPTVFSISYRYITSGQYFDLRKMEIKPYEKNSALYRKYTSEQLPQICFSNSIRNLADSITGSETNPYEIVRKIYYWFNKNIPWAGAMEYSIMPNIPEYVINNKHGDCGMQTLLLMSMLRYKGIPVKWESGWMVPPDNKNLHDWCEVYYEGIGWVPVDVSYQLQYSDDIKTREFYISGIDSYRLIVNDGISGRLYPEKKFLRSEPYDFQRGEVEWNGGNIYFNRWDYSMKITYQDGSSN
jgi:hypothetical protein